MYNGILVVNKETGYTSHDVVAKLRRILSMKKIGHTGTLDPEATGVLPVCLGKATKVAEYLVEKTKVYQVSFLLGISTDTQDFTGQVISEREVLVTEEEIHKLIPSFLGEQWQLPPMFSAIKINGQKLYDLAREGKVIERPKRQIHIMSIEEVKLCDSSVSMTVTCSKGTYIRTLCHDMGESLGCGAHMTSLVRIQSGPYKIEQSYTLDEIEKLVVSGDIEKVIAPTESVFPKAPSCHINETYATRLYNGNELPCLAILEDFDWADQCLVHVYDTENRYIGIYCYGEKEQNIKPVKVFL